VAALSARAEAAEAAAQAAQRREGTQAAELAAAQQRVAELEEELAAARAQGVAGEEQVAALMRALADQQVSGGGQHAAAARCSSAHPLAAAVQAASCVKEEGELRASWQVAKGAMPTLPQEKAGLQQVMNIPSRASAALISACHHRLRIICRHCLLSAS
jgi:hypothetical protein